MRYRRLDENGDHSFGNGQASFHINTPDGVAQAVVTRLRLWLAEWFLDTTEGTPYQPGALGTNKIETIDPMIRDRILETTGVLEIVNFSSSFDENARHYSISVTIKTVYGTATINEVL